MPESTDGAEARGPWRHEIYDPGVVFEPDVLITPEEDHDPPDDPAADVPELTPTDNDQESDSGVFPTQFPPIAMAIGEPPDAPPSASLLPAEPAAEVTASEILEVQQQAATEVLEVIDELTATYTHPDAFVADTDGFFAPARSSDVLAVLRAAQVQPGEQLVDLGSGDGRVVDIAGAVLGMDAYGYERNPERHELASRALEALVGQAGFTDTETDRIHLIHDDFLNADISDADVLFFYQGGAPLYSVVDKIVSEAKDGARVIMYGVTSDTPLDAPLEPITGLQLPGVRTPSQMYRVVKPAGRY
jgi:precorrin-6B methylase 2